MTKRLAFLFFILLISLFFFVLTYGSKIIGPNEVGVKVFTHHVSLIIKKTRPQTILQPGFVMYIPFVQKIITLPNTPLNLHINHQVTATTNTPIVTIQTKDNVNVSMDDIYVYYAFNFENGESIDEEEGRISALIQSELSHAILVGFSELNTSDYFGQNSLLLDAVQHVQTAMNEALISNGIEIQDILINHFHFPKEFEEIFAVSQKLQNIEKLDELKITETALENQKAIFKITTEADNYVSELLSNGKRYHEKKLAEGDYLVSEATAYGNKLVSDALSGKGGENVLRYKMAEAPKRTNK